MLTVPRIELPGITADAYQVTLRAICQHVVALIGTYEHLDDRGRPTGPAKPYSYTACVFENRGSGSSPPPATS